MTIDFEAEANTGPDQTQLKLISDLAQRQLTLEQRITRLLADLLDANKQLKQVQEFDLPEAMLAANCTAFTLASGAAIEIEKGLTASLSQEKKPLACSWLREHGYGDIVSDKVAVNFSKGQEAQAKAIIDLLIKNNVTPTVTTDVNTATLKALIRENMRKGIDMPLDTLGAYIWRKSKITP